MSGFRTWLKLHIMLAIPLLVLFCGLFFIALSQGIEYSGLLVGIPALVIIILNARYGLRCRFVRKALYSCTSVCCSGGRADLGGLCQECRLSRSRRTIDHEEFARRFRNTQLNLSEAHLGKGARTLILLTLIMGPLLALLLPDSDALLRPWIGQTLRVTEKLEVGSVLGSIILVAFTLIFQNEQKRFSQSKILFGFVLACFVGLLVALVMLFWLGVEDPHGLHILALLVYSVCATIYDFLGSRWGAAGDDRAELLETCIILDFPMLLSSVSLAILWNYLKKENDSTTAATAESLLAGALAMQFMISACLFAFIRSGLIRSRAKSASDRETLPGPEAEKTRAATTI